jgi:tetratricopeptide (TPR) repeat protein
VAAESIDDMPGSSEGPAKGGTQVWVPGAPRRPLTAVGSGPIGDSDRPTWIEALLGKEEPHDESVRLAAGDLVAGTRYRIVRWIGEGGMGVVYEAEHVDLERRVALKLLRSEYCRRPETVRLFRDEARATSRIGSDNIVEIYDFAELPDGRLAIAMELLHGFDLTRFRGQAMPPVRVVGILRQVCRGLAAAHAAGIVHRDVKPENIYLHTRRGRGDAVKLVDFGIAAFMSSEGRPVVPAGTPYYVAPETIVFGAVSPHVDMYALGCLAYELLSGRVPFEAGDLQRVLQMHVAEPPPPLTDLVPECPPALAAVVMRCLAKDPDARFADMTDLEAALCEAQIAANLRSSWDDLTLPDVEPVRREKLLPLFADPNARSHARRRWFASAVAGVALLFAGGIGANWIADRSSAPTAIHDAALGARAAAARASFVYPPADAPDEPTAYRYISELETIVGPDALAAREEAARLRGELSATLVRLGDEYWDRPGGREFARSYYAQALLFEPGHAHARTRAGATDEELEALGAKSSTAGFTGDELLAAEPLQVLAEPDEGRRERKLDDYQERRRQRMAQIDRDLSQLTWPTDNTSEGSRAVPVAARTPKSSVAPIAAAGIVAAVDPPAQPKPAPRDPQTSGTRASAGTKALRGGNLAEAQRLFEQALAHDRKNLVAMAGLRDVFFDRGDYNRAVQYGEKAVDLAPRSAAHRLRLGDAYYKVLRMSDARKQYEKALALGDERARWRLDKVAASLAK